MGISDFLILLFFLTGGSHAFVYSCEEVKYKLINSDLGESTQYACLVLPMDSTTWNWDYLKMIFIQFDKVSTSLFDLASNTCVERTGSGPWRIVSDGLVDLDCNEEFTLLLTSSYPNISLVDPWWKNAVLDNERVYVSPYTGIRLHKLGCSGTGTISVYTGAGIGEKEDRYLMKAWRCADLPEWIHAFENVMTVTPDSDVLLEIEYYFHNDYEEIDASSNDLVAVMASGRSDNRQCMYPLENDVKIFIRTDVIVNVVSFTSIFDDRYGGYLTLSGQLANGQQWMKNFQNDSFFPSSTASYLKVAYISDAVAPEDIWNSQDNFVMEITLSDLSADPIIEPDKYCGCDLDNKFGMPVGWDTTQIWLDIVIILDTSEAMGDVSLTDASILIESFFGSGGEDILSTDQNAKFYTRVGLIAMSDEAETLYNLNMTKNDKVQGKVHIKKGVPEIDVVDACNAAIIMLNDGKTGRDNTRQVIYYVTDSDPKSDLSSLDEFKSTRGVVIVNNFLEPGRTESPGLKNLASEGFYYKDIQYNYMSSIQLFCKANCYCRAEWDPYAGHNLDPAVKSSGGCMHAVPSGVQFNNAIKNCGTLGGGRLVSLHDSNKTAFANELMKQASPKSAYFWIGYSKYDVGWEWEDQSYNYYTNWNVNEPNPAAVAKCAYVDTTSTELYWGAGNCNVGFPSVCEFAPCAVGNNMC